MPPPPILKNDMEEKIKEIDELSAMLRLAEVLNDSERTIKLGGREFKIKALRPGSQWLIAEESCKIAKAGESFTDIIKQFAVNAPAVIRCICIAILNDKNKIEGKEYQDLYDFIQWETNSSEWIGVLVEVLQMINYDFFFRASEAIHSLRQTMIKTHQPQSTPQRPR